MRALAHALLAALLTLLVLPAVAGAHATIVRTTPADGALLKTAPRDVQLRFSESVDLGPGSVRLLDATGKEMDAPAARHAGGDRGDRGSDAAERAGGRDVRRRLAGHVGRLASGLRRVLVQHRRAERGRRRRRGLDEPGRRGLRRDRARGRVPGSRADARRRLRPAAPVARGPGIRARAALPLGGRRRCWRAGRSRYCCCRARTRPASSRSASRSRRDSGRRCWCGWC